MYVSVIIPVYNRKNFIRHCLESVLAQDFKGDYEIIVVDDGSTDGTVEILKEFSSRVKLHLSPANQGVSSARNQGARLAQGQFVAMIDSDCLAHPQWLSQLVLPFEQDNGIMMVGGKVEDIAHNYWQMVNKGLSTFVSHHSEFVKQLIGCNMAFRREFILKNPYDPRFKFAAGDDTELCWRCRELGFKVYYTSNAIVQHHHRCTLKAGFIQHFLYGYINTYTTLKYHEFPYINYGARLIILIFLFSLMGCVGIRWGFQLATVGSILFSLLPLYHSIRPRAKTLYEIIITYPGSFLLYLTFCAGSLVYFIIPHAFIYSSSCPPHQKEKSGS